MAETTMGRFFADQEGSERLRAVMGATADAIVTIDESSLIVDVNPATETMFGYSAEELFGRDINTLLPLPHRDQDDEFVERYLEADEASLVGVGRELIAHRKDGTTFPVELSVDEIEHRGLSVALIRDISERRKLEQDVVNAAEEERIAVARELHDGVGSLLTAIKFRTAAFAKSLDPKGVENAEELGVIVELVQDATTQVRAISRGLHPVGAHPEDLVSALRSLAIRANWGPEFQCELHCDSAVSIQDQTISNHLFRIAQEAVSNALKHSKASKIDITLERTGDAVVLIVADNGEGISLDVSEADGLGLLTMRYRANAINATLTIEPQESGGTCVTCLLPVTDEA